MLNIMKRRLDLLLVERGLAESREKAHALILAGEVLVNERVVAKPATQVRADVPIRLRQKPPFVSRGGIKLAHALDQFHIDVGSLVVLDVGTSTGDSPIVCLNGGQAGFMPSMSAMDNWTTD